MPLTRHFLDPGEPLTGAVAKRLLAGARGDPVDLGGILLLLPTRQAARRVRERLAQECGAAGGGLLSPPCRLPMELVVPCRGTPPLASSSFSLATWCRILLDRDPAHYPGLFPSPPPQRGFSWALHVAQRLQRLRDELIEGGYLLKDVPDRLADECPEPARWADLRALEGLYLERIRRAGLEDRGAAMARFAREPVLPEGISSIVVAGVPDLAPVVVQALSRLAESVPVEILVHAGEADAGAFDAWGRVEPRAWTDRALAIPDPGRNIQLAADETAQAHRVADCLEETGTGPPRPAIGVPDAAVTVQLENVLAERGHVAFDPAGMPLRNHRLVHLLAAWRDLVRDDRYESLASWIRHPDLLAHFARHGIDAEGILVDLDTFQNLHLPVTLEDVSRHLGSDPARDSLREVVEKTRGWKEAFAAQPFPEAVPALLRAVYDADFDPGDSEERRRFEQVAERLMKGLAGLAGEAWDGLGIGQDEALDLFLQSLEQERIATERGESAITLEGWLELPWSEAPVLLVTGMNEGRVPDGTAADLFLPDSLRRRLGLRHDEGRLARDTHLLHGMLETRRDTGRVILVTGKNTLAGDPLKPSRLLFRCPEEELPARAQQLFGAPYEPRENIPVSVTYRLDPRAGGEEGLGAFFDMPLHVTAFSSYLACPFRFYLGRILGMESCDDRKVEMDALDFGNLVHGALQRMAEEEGLRESTDPEAVAAFLGEAAEADARRRYGSRPPLQVIIQLRSAIERLRAAAAVHAAAVREGWVIEEAEYGVRGLIAGWRVIGKIDRIDRHRDTGALRLVDYKTSDSAMGVWDAHLKRRTEDAPGYAHLTVQKKKLMWINLQLPLYRLLLAQTDARWGEAGQLAYINLPKAAGDAGLSAWPVMDAELFDSAATCAEGVVKDLFACRFWPPQARVAYDSFESLLQGPAGEWVDAERFLEFLDAMAHKPGRGP